MSELQSRLDDFVEPARPSTRRSRQVAVRWGSRVVTVGGDAPVRVQSMTNTDTVNAIETAIQVKELAIAGSEMVRITVNTPEAAQAVPHIREQLDRMGIDVPLIGDFHYNGHRLLTDFPDCAQALSKYRINPGNVGKGAIDRCVGREQLRTTVLHSLKDRMRTVRYNAFGSTRVNAS